MQLIRMDEELCIILSTALFLFLLCYEITTQKRLLNEKNTLSLY